ncbi:Predicted dithiol-disulfide isomerase, DsbA family [Dyadobacter koreensis]|uniref:Predicted dithiol-disulfide isomerase, DsbA family n=1 Tax=Dyadobacter koreensis TaxID=408657 RepID=A0A1H6TKB1_9BACT|nr:DsbA family oxidoreductase [Dyadobacter koreensis]SEI80461.1 Predicted dithiol-disulfide isomerase, DsbA family [Dyadobacter koreensis]
MKVEIWSDVMCPWCYIGKRKFEKALEQFPQKERIEVEWKSFQLNPDMETDPNKNIVDYLVEAKGITTDHATQMLDNVTNVAAEVGLDYHMEKAVLANSFDSHRFIQFAKKNRKGDAAEEQLFHAYFTEGKNTADHNTLIDLGVKIGLDAGEVKSVLDSNQFADDVRKDIYEAQQVGARGVPFFVLDRKYAVSGAQQTETFLGALQKSFQEWEKENPAPIQTYAEGDSCTTDGVC